MNRVIFTLHISAEQYAAFYRGAVKTVQVMAHDGRTVRFPANALRKHVTREGIHGTFELEFDQNNKLLGLRRL